MRSGEGGLASNLPVSAFGGGSRPTPVGAFARPDDSGAVAVRLIDIKMTLHRRLLDVLNLAAVEVMPRGTLETEVGTLVRALLAEQPAPLNQAEKTRLVDEVLDELTGLGPLEPLLKDGTVSDILVNTYRDVFVERQGRLELTPVRFKDDRHLMRIIDKVVSSVGRRIDESQPMVDARLADGSRVNAIIPPLAVDGPLLSIRKFAPTAIDMARLIELGTVPKAVAVLLQGLVRCRRNVIISGGTGSGKTTLLNAMSAAIGDRERIVTIEDAAELQLQQRHVARLETRPTNLEGKGEVTQRDLVRNALRMRPDRIIIGEVRAGEAFDMMQAMNTGHEGSMSTIHANSCRDALLRLEQMLSMAGLDLPARTLRGQIASALHVIVQLERMSDGRRRLVSLSEVAGLEGETVTIQEIACFEREGTEKDGSVRGRFRATGVRPHFVRMFQAYGLEVPAEAFDPDRPMT
jgi:pilus assembly protein CpaF